MILDEIVGNKLKEIAQRKKEVPLAALKSKIATLAPTKDFKKAISSSRRINIIAEIKRSSPSAGLIRQDFDPAKLATTYKNNGASAISVLTDKKFFSGDPENLTKVRGVCSLPVLAKEFILDEYQIYEARTLGADAILLIARMLDREDLRKYLDLASRLDLACLVEIYEEEEWEKIKGLPIDIVGINNRNLANSKVDLKTSFSLVKKLPSDKIVVSESGIDSRENIDRLREAGVRAFLIGGTLLKSRDVGKKLRELLHSS